MKCCRYKGRLPILLRLIGDLRKSLGDVLSVLIFPDQPALAVLDRFYAVEVPHFLCRRRKPIGPAIDPAILLF